MEIVQPYENLLAGFQSHVVTREIVVAPNQELSLGQVFELNAQGQAVAPTEPSDASKAFGIMADAIATGGTAKKSVYYAAGEFNKHKVILPDDADFNAYDQSLGKIGIYLNDVVKAEEAY
ncbi:hypothetical protein SLU01_19330 [Sporosarcina luteola]|uniref:Head decoration protein n=1 Tax=Sporosarcina luteola TaxID=582850 RepID=A0A511Z845_9BACL|nr:head decoration protein [Sporosarcina luteola]GEN83621.1 hypothetical protein SLU01_19330 [Sporosarcina luteola]